MTINDNQQADPQKKPKETKPDDKAAELFNTTEPGNVPVGDPEPKEDEFVYDGLAGKFKTQEELTTYTKGLEEKLVLAEMDKQKTEKKKDDTVMDAVTGNKSNDASWTQEQADRLFEDPAKVLQELETKIENKIELRDAQKAVTENFWTTFYKDNNDLTGQERIVKSVMNEKMNEIGHLTPAQAKEIIAKEARELISHVRGTGGDKKILASSDAAVLDSSKGIHQESKPAPEKPTTFIEELKQFRA